MLVKTSRETRTAAIATLCGFLLVAASMIVPLFLEADVRVHWPPMHADWLPRFSWLSLMPIAVGLALWQLTLRFAAVLSWRALTWSSVGATWVWTMALALSDGASGISRVYERAGEYVYDAQRVGAIGPMLSTFVERIPYAAQPDNWRIHVAGHPPGALLYFVGFDRLGITSPFWIGVTVLTIGTTAVAAVLLTLRVLGSEELARKAAPWLILAPTAVWMGSAGDAMFTAVAAWGLLLLALAARRGSAIYGVGAGVLLGYCVYSSYGLTLLGILAVTVLWLGRSWRPLPWALLGALGVAAVFTAFGFYWWEAYPVLVERYYDGMASDRAYSYWVWANIAAWTFTAGLAVWAALPRAAAELRRRNPLAVLAAAAGASIVVATLSGMSKAETERIFLPFTLWIVALPALLPARWAKPALLSQVVLALLAQFLILTRW